MLKKLLLLSEVHKIVFFIKERVFQPIFLPSSKNGPITEAKMLDARKNHVDKKNQVTVIERAWPKLSNVRAKSAKTDERLSKSTKSVQV